jgi:hypothetical protein
MQKIIFILYLKFQFLGVFAKLQKVTVNFNMSACLSTWNNWDPSESISMKFDISVFFKNLFKKFKFN